MNQPLTLPSIDAALATLAGVIERRGEEGCGDHLWKMFDRLEAERDRHTNRTDRLAQAKRRAAS